ncbi:hypothetical protein D7Z54_00305 [Salibacterium salarium]|uniref:Uncharacterized protein n=1 Tax=Salibacterium salarium TaxID=284579 RepID=A0A3R9QQ10_9BACI|nr:hypothetical protein D7Z54_00305 [Salibacterium salarium]
MRLEQARLLREKHESKTPEKELTGAFEEAEAMPASRLHRMGDKVDLEKSGFTKDGIFDYEIFVFIISCTSKIVLSSQTIL